MPKIPFFSGDFYTVEDPGSESSQLFNLIPQVIESGTGKSVGRYVGTPGLQLFASVGDGPQRCLWMGEGRMYSISGASLYEVFADGAATNLGNVGDDDAHSPAQIFPTGNELFVVSAGYAWRQYNDLAGAPHVDKIKLIAAEYTDLAIGVKAFYYDLEIDATTNTKVSSATRAFVAGDVGLTLHITSGIDWTPGTYTISSVTGGVATLSAAVGVAGSPGGVGELIDTTWTNEVNSPTLAFVPEDVGGTLVIDPVNPPGFTPGTYTITAVADGIATLSAVCGTPGTLGGVAVQYPGASASTDGSGYLKAGSGAWLDGYAIVAPPDTNEFLISDPADLSHWSALDKGTKEGYPDHILALLADHEELYIFGDLQSAEAWRNTGAANFPFERNMGAFMHYGLAAKDSLCQLGLNGIAWIGWSAGRGAPQAYFAAGFQPQRISTPMIEHLWDQYSTVRDARAYSYVEDGHHFWQVTFPSADITWCYDYTSSQQMGKPMWHVRGVWDGTAWHRVRSNCHTYGYFLDDPSHAGGTWTKDLSHFTGDYETGNIYVQSLSNFTDMGTPIRRQLQSVHLANENKRTVWNLFQLECLVADENDIEWTLDYSRDRAWTFLNPRMRSATGGGRRNQRLRWWRCGESYDQVWRLITDSSARISITSAWFDAKGAGS